MFTENGYYFGQAGEMEKKEAVELHHKRYEEVGFFRKNEADPYEKKSTYFVARKADGAVTGVTRLIFDKLDQLPTFQHFDIFDLDRARMSQLKPGMFAEVSAFTKQPQHDVGVGLLKAIYQYSLKKNVTHWVCCMDERVYNYMQRMFFASFRVIGESKVYLGSRTIPCVMNLPESAVHVQGRRKQLYDYFHSFEQESTEAIQ